MTAPVRARRRPGRPALICTACIASMGLWHTPPTSGQEPPGGIDGPWGGALAILGTELAFTVTFTTTDDGLEARMDIPVQGAFGLPLIEVSIDASHVHFELQAGPGLAVWDGLHEGEVIEGTFTQGGAAGTFRVERGGTAADAEAEETEAEPVPYREEEVTFENGSFHFEGTLTLPEGTGPFPAVVMITGSGAQDRDEQLVGFRPFRVIADHLSRRGVAVYRYDDRGVGGSTGSVAFATTSDFADDVLAAVTMLAERPDIDAARIGLIGHSEGGVVAPLAASRSEAVAFSVLLAGTGVTGEEILYEQSALIARAGGASEDDIADQARLQRRLFDALRNGDDLDELRADIEAAFRAEIETASEEERAGIADVDVFVATRASQQIAQLETPWFRYFLTYDPATALRQVEIPVLALFGELDLQVPDEQNRDPMAEALGGNPDVTIRVIEGANHLFQAADTGSPSEYAELEKAFIPGFLEIVSDWILERVGS